MSMASQKGVPVQMLAKKILAVAVVLFCLPSISLSIDGVGGMVTLAPSTFPDEKEAILLNTGWRWHPGDDSAWSAPAFDDSDWAPADTQLPGRLLSRIGWDGIGWFRLHVEADPALWGQALTFECFAFGAIEVYLDGELAYSAGIVGDSLASEHVDYSPMRERPMVPIVLPNKSRFTLATRYSNFTPLKYMNPSRAVRSTGFWLYMSTGSVETRMRQQAADGRRSIGYPSLLVGMLAASMVLHLLLFLFQRQQKANLYYALYVGSAAAGIYLLNVQLGFISSLREFSWFMKSSQLVLMLAGLLGCRSLYSLFYTRLPKVFWFFVGGYLLCLAATWYVSYAVFLLYVVICFGEMLRIIIIACVQKKEDAWIFAVGSAILLVVGVSQVLSGIITLVLQNNFPRLRPSVWLVGFFCFFTSMSTYLARRYAKANEQQALLEVENAQKSYELQTAREVQQFFLQRGVPAVDGFDVALTCEATNETGGDFVSHFWLDKDQTQLGIVLMDVVGHGLKAAMMASLANGVFQAEIRHEQDPHSIVQRMDQVLQENLPPNAFVAMSLAVVNVNERQVSYFSAGFPRPILLRGGDPVDIEIAGDLPLGSALETEYVEHSITLAPGDVLLLFSDGLLEAKSLDGETYGDSRLRAELAVLAAQELSAQVWAGEWLADVRRHTYPGAPQDDVSIVVLKVL